MAKVWLLFEKFRKKLPFNLLLGKNPSEKIGHGSGQYTKFFIFNRK